MWKKIKLFRKSETLKTIIETKTQIILNSEIVESVGIRIVEDDFAPLIKKGELIPVERTYVFSTWADNQDQIKLFFYRGNDKKVENNTFLGEYQIINIPLEPAGEPQIEVTVGISNEKIWISAIDLKTKKRLEIINLNGYSDSDIFH